MAELHSLSSANYDELKKWIYPMFFSTRAGPHRVKIINSVSVKPKRIRAISIETHMTYDHVKYNLKLLLKDGFLIKNDKEYVISPKFKENYDVLTDITKNVFNFDERKP